MSEPDAPACARLFLAALPAPGLLSLHLTSELSLCLREQSGERRAETGRDRGICEMRQVLGCGQSGQSSQSLGWGWAMVAILE